jgi:hypothetical protein
LDSAIVPRREKKMARFYASIQGNRSEATRQGTETSGIVGHIRGWHIGARVECWVNEQGDDVVRVYRTKGSHNPARELIAEFTSADA